MKLAALLAGATLAADTCTPVATDALVLNTPLDDFLAARAAREPAACDWSSDNCSSSPDRPAGFDFVPACQRHDFGYRNARAQGRLDEALRLRYDDRFRADMYARCDGESGLRRAECRRIADVYYAAVRRLGGRGEGQGLDAGEG